MNKEKRDFKGIWIPKEIWLDINLSLLEKCLLVEIDSLDQEQGCFASNAYFAKFFNKSERVISRLISKFTQENYIKLEHFNGRKRILKSNLKHKLKQKTLDKNDYADTHNRADSPKVASPPSQKCLGGMDEKGLPY